MDSSSAYPSTTTSDNYAEDADDSTAAIASPKPKKEEVHVSRTKSGKRKSAGLHTLAGVIATPIARYVRKNYHVVREAIKAHHNQQLLLPFYIHNLCSLATLM